MPTIAIQIIMFVASVMYSYMQNQAAQKRYEKAKKEGELNAEKAKGFEITVEKNPTTLYVPYGRCKAGGVRVHHSLHQSVTLSAPAAGGQRFMTLASGDPIPPKKGMPATNNQFLMIQQAICMGKINRVVAIDVDDKVYNDAELDNSLCIHVYPGGSIADPLAFNNAAERATAVFTSLTYATGIFKLNRDSPQYNGVPNLSFYLEGILLSSLSAVGGNIIIHAPTYSNNPALALLDYLSNKSYGKGLDYSLINLDSFEKAARLCDKVMLTSVPNEDPNAYGKFWKNAGYTRQVKRFEANIGLSTDKPIRENIESLLECMDMAELTWAGGTYKLSLRYPTMLTIGKVSGIDDIIQASDVEGVKLYRAIVDNAPHNMVANTAYFVRGEDARITDDDIISGTEITSTWPSARERFNIATVRFRNEGKDFVEDSATWPERGSTLHLQYLAEDSDQPLETEAFEDGVTDYQHALARAEQRCRFSRIASSYNLTLKPKWTRLEPGDLFTVYSDVLRIQNALLRVTEVKINAKNTLEVSATRYDASILAWNANDAQDVKLPTATPSSLKQASGLTFVTSKFNPNSAGSIGWEYSPDARVSKYSVFATQTPPEMVNATTEWEFLGETRNNYFAVPNIPSGYYTIAVAASTPNGRLARQYGLIPTDRWPILAIGLSGATVDGVTFTALSMYKRATSKPAKPVGGTYDYYTSTITNIPVGWAVLVPSGVDKMYCVTATVNSEEPGCIWSEPFELADSSTLFQLSRSSVVVGTDPDGLCVDYSQAHGSVVARVDGIDVSTSANITYTVESTQDCVVVLGDGARNNYKVTSLNGKQGSFCIKINYMGSLIYRTVGVITVSVGYQLDLRKPPTPAVLNVIKGFSTLFIELQSFPFYLEGHGHKRTEIYSAATSDMAGETLLDSFEDATYTVPSTPGDVRFIRFRNRSKDNVLSDPTLVVDATIPKVRGTYIEEATIKAAHIGTAEVDTIHLKDAAITNAKIGNVIQSANYNPRTFGWNIDKRGNAEFNGALHVSDQSGNTILQASGLGAGVVGSVQIGTVLQSTNYAYRAAGWNITKAGKIEANDIFIRGNGYFGGELQAASGTFAGRLLAGVLDIDWAQSDANIYPNPGTFQVTVPSDKTLMRVTVQGAGGGGGAGGSNNGKVFAYGGPGGGGGAGSVATGTFTVSPGAVITLTVGAGGSAGVAGGGSVVSGYLSTTGGGAGGPGGVPSYSETYGTKGSAGSIGGFLGTDAEMGSYESNTGSTSEPNWETRWHPIRGGYGGMGGNSAFSSGGTGGTGGIYSSAASELAGASAGVGAGGGGGGGGGGNSYYQAGGTGGAGGNGRVVIEFTNPKAVVLRSTFDALTNKYNSLCLDLGKGAFQFSG